MVFLGPIYNRTPYYLSFISNTYIAYTCSHTVSLKTSNRLLFCFFANRHFHVSVKRFLMCWNLHWVVITYSNRYILCQGRKAAPSCADCSACPVCSEAITWYSFMFPETGCKIKRLTPFICIYFISFIFMLILFCIENSVRVTIVWL